MATYRLEIEPTILVRVQGCGGDVEIVGHQAAVLEVDADETLERYVHHDNSSVTIAGYPRDLSIMLPQQASVELYGIGGDVEVRSVAMLQHDGAGHGSAKLVAHSVGGDVSIVDVPNIELGSVGGDTEIQGKCQSAEIGNIGRDLQLDKIERLNIQAVGGDAELGSVGRIGDLGHIGGDLELKWSGEADGNLRAIVGGDASIKLPQTAAFRLTALVGGSVEGHGQGWGHAGRAGTHELVFGEGGPHLYLTVGGDLELSGGPAPQRTTVDEDGHAWHKHPSMDAFGEEMRGLGRELEEMGRNLARELSNLGRDIAREVRVAGRETMRGMDFGPRGRGPRGRVPFSGQDFNFDPEQIERIKREARAAAASGIARAQEAVERALHQRQQAGMPRRPGTPRQPAPPVPPTPTMEPPVGNVYTGQTIRMDGSEQPAQAAANAQRPVDLDAERLAILRMVHEGRLGPDEAEMLLRGLEERS